MANSASHFLQEGRPGVMEGPTTRCTQAAPSVLLALAVYAFVSGLVVVGAFAESARAGELDGVRADTAP